MVSWEKRSNSPQIRRAFRKRNFFLKLAAGFLLFFLVLLFLSNFLYQAPKLSTKLSASGQKPQYQATKLLNESRLPSTSSWKLGDMEDHSSLSHLHQAHKLFDDTVKQSPSEWKGNWATSIELAPDITVQLTLKGSPPSDYQLRKHLLYPDFPQHNVNQNPFFKLDLLSALYVSENACKFQGIDGPDVKYFHENPKRHHLDARFGLETAKNPHSNEERIEILKSLFYHWARFADQRHIPYNIAHGVLLGWTWGQKIMPWDDDLDVQVPSIYLKVLLQWSNQSFFNDQYLLDVNPNFQETSKRKQNLIDARFIDKNTGYFIDITGLFHHRGGSPSSSSPSRISRNRQEKSDNQELILRDKNRHTYKFSDFYPLIRTEFEGVQTWVPYNSQYCIASEYGTQESQSKQTYRRAKHKFDVGKRKWMPY